MDDDRNTQGQKVEEEIGFIHMKEGQLRNVVVIKATSFFIHRSEGLSPSTLYLIITCRNDHFLHCSGHGMLSSLTGTESHLRECYVP